jgi:hypothetical protein
METESSNRKFRFQFNVVLISAVLFSLSTGCQSAMPTTQPVESLSKQKNPPSANHPSKPQTFEEHNFGAYSYSTYDCKVLYNKRYVLNDDEGVLQVASSAVPNYLKNLSASWLGVKNFPAPAVVTWRAKDGVSLSAEVDIGEIFKDQVIRHKVPLDDLPTDTVATADEPGIILVVDDRTISVYMHATVFLKDTATRKGDLRSEKILAFQKTY